MCLVYLQPKPHVLLIGLVQHWYLQQARGAMLRLYRKKRKVLSLTGPPREPIGPGAPAGPVSPCREQTRMATGCLSSSPETATPGTPYSPNPIVRMLHLISRWASRTRRANGTYIALKNWKMRKLCIFYQNMTTLTLLFWSIVFVFQCKQVANDT